MEIKLRVGHVKVLCNNIYLANNKTREWEKKRIMERKRERRYTNLG